tara:strand:+ start:822 stop:1208 length:387 start_codon:yes stop_codon:yes gene_type:complete
MDFSFPDHFRFADSHEYAFADDDLIRIGISAFAVDQLGDIVFVDLPEEGTVISKGESFGSVESVKAVEDMYAPMSGEIIHRNNSVMSSPEELQNDPHGEGWLLIIRPKHPDQWQELMDSATYSKKISA